MSEATAAAPKPIVFEKSRRVSTVRMPGFPPSCAVIAIAYDATGKCSARRNATKHRSSSQVRKLEARELSSLFRYSLRMQALTLTGPLTLTLQNFLDLPSNP